MVRALGYILFFLVMMHALSAAFYLMSNLTLNEFLSLTISFDTSPSGGCSFHLTRTRHGMGHAVSHIGFSLPGEKLLLRPEYASILIIVIHRSRIILGMLGCAFLLLVNMRQARILAQHSTGAT